MKGTLHEAAAAYMKHLESEGKSSRTLYTYAKDFEQIEAFFGPDRKLKSILPGHVGKFFKSDELLKVEKTGRPRAKATIEKTKRVFRMFLVWAVETKRIPKLPLPKDTPLGRSLKKSGEQGSHTAAA